MTANQPEPGQQEEAWRRNIETAKQTVLQATDRKLSESEKLLLATLIDTYESTITRLTTEADAPVPIAFSAHVWHTVGGRRKHMATNDYDYELNSPEYEAACIAHNEACGVYQRALEAYREGEIETTEYLAARQAYTEADWRFDEAYSREQERNDNLPTREPEEAVSLQGELAI